MLLLLAVGSMTEAYSQSWLEQVGKTAVKRARKKAIEKTEEKIYKKVEKTVDKAVDKAFEKTEKAIVEATRDNTADEIHREDTNPTEKFRRNEEKAAESKRKLVIEQFKDRGPSGEPPFHISQKGVTITYASKDANGGIISYSKTSVVDVDYKDSKNFTVETTTELYSNEMELLTSTPMTSRTIVEEGVVTFDPGSMAGQLSEGMEITGDYFFVPDNIAVGDILTDYKVEIAIGPIKTISESTDVHVSGRETIKISGHSIDCYIIESTITSKVMGMKSKMVQKAWYGRNTGQVRTETYDLTGILLSANEIIEIEGL